MLAACATGAADPNPGRLMKTLRVDMLSSQFDVLPESVSFHCPAVSGPVSTKGRAAASRERDGEDGAW